MPVALNYLIKYRKALACTVMIVGTLFWAYMTGKSHGLTEAEIKHNTFVTSTLKKQIQSNQAVMNSFNVQKKQFSNISNDFAQLMRVQRQSLKKLEADFNDYLKHFNRDNCMLDARGVQLINEIIDVANTPTKHTKH